MNRRHLVLLFSNLIPAFFIMIFAYAHFLRFLTTPGLWRVSHLLLVFQMGVVGFSFMVRQAPLAVSWRPWDVFVAQLGTFAPLLFSLEYKGVPRIPGLMFQIVGTGFSIYALVSLGRSYGILPAHRGIHTRGLFRFVRHPIYASYQIANLGFLINHFGSYNLAVVGICLLSQVLRIFAEERFLASDPEYGRYHERVRWRLIPFIF